MMSFLRTTLCVFVLAGLASAQDDSPTACNPQYDNAKVWDQAYVSKTAFRGETWPEARMLFYVVGGNDAWGLLEADGAQSTTPPDKNTDVMVITEEDAQKRGFKKPETRFLAGKTERVFELRHLTIEAGADTFFQKLEVYGNVWIKRGASLQTHYWVKFQGDQHTFLRSDMVHDREVDGMKGLRALEDAGKASDVVRIPDAAGQWRWFASLMTKLGISTMPEFNKTDGKSVELIGQMFFRGELKIASGGSVILAPNAVVFSGGDRRRHSIGGDLVLLDNAYLARSTPDENDLFGADVQESGVIQAGLPQRPLTRDCYFCLNTKPGSGDGQKRIPISLDVKGDIKVHSADPAQARLVFLRDGRESVAGNDGQAARGISLRFGNPNMTLDGVLFDDVMQKGIWVSSPAQRESWKNVFFGEHCAGKPEDLFVYGKEGQK